MADNEVHEDIDDRGLGVIALPAAPPHAGGLLDELHHLPFEQRVALLLREGLRLDRDEIAYVLDLSAARTRAMLVDARITLAQASDPGSHDGPRARLERLRQRLQRR